MKQYSILVVYILPKVYITHFHSGNILTIFDVTVIEMYTCFALFSNVTISTDIKYNYLLFIIRYYYYYDYYLLLPTLITTHSRGECTPRVWAGWSLFLFRSVLDNKFESKGMRLTTTTKEIIENMKRYSTAAIGWLPLHFECGWRLFYYYYYHSSDYCSLSIVFVQWDFDVIVSINVFIHKTKYINLYTYDFFFLDIFYFWNFGITKNTHTNSTHIAHETLK